MTRRTLIRNPKAAQRHNGEGHRKGLIENAPSKGSQTDRNTNKGDKAQ
jgi:hypothetical protein